MTTLLRDDFTGAAGPLSAHAANTGQSWAGTDAGAVLDGGGYMYAAGSNTRPILRSNASIPQGAITLSIAISIGAFPAGAYDYTEDIVAALWGWYDYSIEVHSRDPNKGNTPHIYVRATSVGGGSTIFDAPIAANTQHTVAWEIAPGVPTKIYFDGVLVLTASGVPRADAGSTAFGGYLDRYQDAGAPDAAAFLKFDSITIDSATPTTPPETPSFWTAFTRSREIV